MSAARQACPECGTPLDRDGGGLCTACMLRLGLDDEPTRAEETLDVRSREPAARPIDEPATVGPYVIERLLGEGGMGRVYLARQEAPIRRTVALKLIKSGIDSADTLKRFESERRSLELMDHDSIARVLDAGTTPDGRPYFVMEYVDGVPITTYCDEQQLSARERIALLIRVCEAVQHAHVKGVIHRDIKPSNVLVTRTERGPLPKVIDFGIAKATGERLLEWSHYTEMGRLVGTPAYMSPEQADTSRRDVDTRTDVYSLGVMLYELLVGHTPHDPRAVREAGLEEMLRRIRETELPAPSLRLSTLGDDAQAVAEVRATDPGRLARLVRGELDWITMRALEKDRERRYGSSRELADDLERFLGGRPVLARPPSRAYLARKFVRRHRLAVGAAVAAIATLVLFSAAMAWQANLVARERDRARLEAATSERVTGLLVDLFRSSNPFGGEGPEVSARAILDRGTERAQSALAGEPRVLARVLAAMGRAYHGLGELDEAANALEDSLAMHRPEPGEASRAVADVTSALAAVRFAEAKYDESERLFRRANEIRSSVLGPRHAETLAGRLDLPRAWMDAGRLDDARAELSELHPLFAETLGADAPETLEAGVLLASVLSHSGDTDLAAPLIDAGVERLRLSDDRYDQRGTRSMMRLAWVCTMLGRYDEATDLYGRVIEHTRRFFGPDHPLELHVQGMLNNVLGQQQRWDTLLPLSRSLFERKGAVLGEEHPETLFSGVMHGATLVDAGRLAESEETLLRVIEGYERNGLRNWGWLRAKTVLANVIRLAGRYGEALAAHREIQAPCEQSVGERHPVCRANLKGMAVCLRELGREDEAAELDSRFEELGGSTGVLTAPAPH